MKIGKRVLIGVLTTAIMAITLLAGMPMGKGGVVNAARRNLKNPSGGIWDCVYFGSYPQSDATGKTKEPIKWRVLSVNGNDAFLVADRNLDVQKYNDTDEGVTWETCTMRSWLNGYGSASNVCKKDYSSNSFISRAFTSSEQGAILSTAVKNAKNPEYGTDGGNDTIDKIFLLSYDEATNPSYGFAPYIRFYSHMSDSARERRNTAYVAAGGTIGLRERNEEGRHDLWWLRSPGIRSNDALAVYLSGVIYYDGDSVYDDGRAVCPALHLNLASSLWSYAGTVNQNGESVETTTETIKESSDLADIPKEVQAVTDASIASQSSEDVKGAVFNALQARTTKLTNKSITLKWKKVSKADGYKIYGNRCGKKNHYKLIKDVEKSKTSYIQKQLNKGTYYKYVVAAYKVVDGKKVTIAVSKTIHAVTTGGKYGVAKSVKINKSKVTLKKGKKFTVKATEVKKDKKIKNHRKIAYESSNTKVATVSKKGVIKAKKKGTCYIYVYAQNGVYKRIKVTVK